MLQSLCMRHTHHAFLHACSILSCTIITNVGYATSSSLSQQNKVGRGLSRFKDAGRPVTMIIICNLCDSSMIPLRRPGPPERMSRSADSCMLLIAFAHAVPSWDEVRSRFVFFLSHKAGLLCAFGLHARVAFVLGLFDRPRGKPSV